MQILMHQPTEISFKSRIIDAQDNLSVVTLHRRNLNRCHVRE